MIDKLTNNICQVLCGNKKGTGFLISNSLVVTVFHVVKKYEKESIKLNFRGKNIDAQLHESINEEYKKIDIAVLKLTEKVDFYKNMIFLDIDLLPKKLWLSRGYPSVTGSIGTNLIDDNNYINQQLKKLKNDKIDIVLNMSQTFDSYKGLSGSPLVVNNKIVGIINTELEENGVSKELYALSYKYFKALIEKLSKDEQKENEITDILRNGKSIELVKVELDDNRTLYVGKYPVTFEEYDLFWEENKNIISRPSSEGFGRGKNPVINVSWNDAISYCTWLSEKDENIYELLSLEEWMGIDSQVILKKEQIWNDEKEIIEVDKLNSNNLGLYHFYGNVNEWCSDDSLETRIAIGGSYRNKNLKRKIKKLPSMPSSQIGFRIKQIDRESIGKS